MMGQTKALDFICAICLLVIASICLLESACAEDEVTYLDSYCSDDGNYNQGSQFQNNLDLLLSNLTTKATDNKFYNFTAGNVTDRVYGLFLCNSAYTNQVCEDCVLMSKGEIQRRCTSSKDADIWYSECMLRYANYNIFSVSDVSRENYIAGGPRKYSESRLGRHIYPPFTAGDLREYLNAVGSNCVISHKTGVGKIAFEGTQGGVVLSPSCRLMYRFTDNGLHPTGYGLYVALGIVSLTAAASLLLNVVVCLRRSTITGKPTGLDDIETMENLHFEFGAIRSATDNFSASNKLGQGGFGIVYMGTLADGQAVAVKRLSNTSKQGIREFKTEACLTAKLQHKNLVKLFGFCLEKDEMLLVYEFVPNKSLDRYLFGNNYIHPKRSTNLTWETRYKILVGIARGLLYLHEDSRPKIVHRDLKPSNILLDAEMNSKIADFGMAKLFGGDQTQGDTSRVAGTFGYMAPEYISAGHFSVKSDIFSYGVILLEIISGLRMNSSDPEREDEKLLNYVWRLWDEGKHMKFLDATLGSEFSKDEVERCIHVGLLCIQEDPAKRPNTASVLFMLHTKPIDLPQPELPPTFSSRPYGKQAGLRSHYSVLAENSITELAPR